MKYAYLFNLLYSIKELFHIVNQFDIPDCRCGSVEDSSSTLLGRRFEYLNPGNDRHKLLVTSNAKKEKNVHAVHDAFLFMI